MNTRGSGRFGTGFHPGSQNMNILQPPTLSWALLRGGYWVLVTSLPLFTFLGPMTSHPGAFSAPQLCGLSRPPYLPEGAATPPYRKRGRQWT